MAKKTAAAPAKAKTPIVDRRRPAALKVRATMMGLYEYRRRREGDVFTLSDAKHYSKKWMEWVDPSTPERLTTHHQSMRREHDATLAIKAGISLPPDTSRATTADDDVI